MHHIAIVNRYPSDPLRELTDIKEKRGGEREGRGKWEGKEVEGNI